MENILICKVPSEFIMRANDSVKYPEARVEFDDLYNVLQTIINDEKNFIVLPSDVYEGTNVPMYDIEIYGDAKDFKILPSDVEDKRKEVE